MALTPQQEQALLQLLEEKKLSLSELPAATDVALQDLLLTRQGIIDKSVTMAILQKRIAPPATLTTAGINSA